MNEIQKLINLEWHLSSNFGPDWVNIDNVKRMALLAIEAADRGDWELDIPLNEAGETAKVHEIVEDLHLEYFLASSE
jgi:hypothetical protein